MVGLSTTWIQTCTHSVETNIEESVGHSLVNDKDTVIDLKQVPRKPETDHSHMEGWLKNSGIFAGEVVAIIRYISKARRRIYGT